MRNPYERSTGLPRYYGKKNNNKQKLQTNDNITIKIPPFLIKESFDTNNNITIPSIQIGKTRPLIFNCSDKIKQNYINKHLDNPFKKSRQYFNYRSTTNLKVKKDYCLQNLVYNKYQPIKDYSRNNNLYNHDQSIKIKNYNSNLIDCKQINKNYHLVNNVQMFQETIKPQQVNRSGGKQFQKQTKHSYQMKIHPSQKCSENNEQIQQGSLLIKKSSQIQQQDVEQNSAKYSSGKTLSYIHKLSLQQSQPQVVYSFGPYKYQKNQMESSNDQIKFTSLKKQITLKNQMIPEQIRIKEKYYFKLDLN